MFRRSVGQLLVIAKSFRAACRTHGVARTVRLGLHELLFDLRYRTETSIVMPGCRSEPGGGISAHEGTNPLVFAVVLRHARFATDRQVFLDFGSGKGRALILAARHGFAMAIGVESSAELCAVARTNIARYARRHPGVLHVTCADAAHFEVPVEVTVAYFFNPFGATTMSAVIDRIGESLARVPRDFHVIYLNPRLAALFLRAGFVAVHRVGGDALILFRPG